MLAILSLAAGVVFAIDVTNTDFERLVTAALTLLNTLLIWRLQHRAKTQLEPQLEKIAAVTTRVIGERQPTGEREPWNGEERRGNGE